MHIRQAALMAMAACAASWAHAAYCCVAPNPIESFAPCPDTAPMDTSNTSTGAEDDAAPDAVRSFTLTIKVLQNIHARTRAPRAVVRHATGDKYDIDSDFKLILDLWSATRCRAVPEAADRRARRMRK